MTITPSPAGTAMWLSLLTQAKARGHPPSITEVETAANFRQAGGLTRTIATVQAAILERLNMDAPPKFKEVRRALCLAEKNAIADRIIQNVKDEKARAGAVPETALRRFIMEAVE